MIEFGDWQLRPVDSLNWQLWHYHEGRAIGRHEASPAAWRPMGRFYSYSTIDSAALFAADCEIKAMDGTVGFPEYVELLRETLDGFEKSILASLERAQGRANG